MKYCVSFIVLICLLLSCKPTNKVVSTSSEAPTKVSDTVRIANEETEYEVIIIDPGFNTFLYSQARPRGFYSELFLEQRNVIYVNEWNMRARQPLQYDSDLYLMQIDYDPNIHYGYEVNYLLYNYFVYFQLKYKQRLGGFVPRI
ncbi:MAG: hypothetical protein J0L86_10310 [Flavobacteriales bacterium]|nr:hypothetical protein [Flavobacteriales bacterium]